MKKIKWKTKKGRGIWVEVFIMIILMLVMLGILAESIWKLVESIS